MSSLIYPHALTMFDQNCDICGKNCDTYETFNTCYKGWFVCKDENCKNTISKWKDILSINKSELKEKFTDWVYVKRSSGILESGWNIISNAWQEKENGPYWVKVRNDQNKLTKYIQLSDLSEWNMTLCI